MGKTQDVWSNKTWKKQCKKTEIFKKYGEKEKIRPYYWKSHRLCLGFYLALVSLLCIFLIPFALNLVARFFAIDSRFTEDIVANEESSSDNESESSKEDAVENNQEQDEYDATSEDADSSSGEGKTKDSSKRESITGLQLLPDFLGGMAGILVGFILDFWFIDRLKIIRHYEAMLNPLDREFKDIKAEYDRRCERQGQVISALLSGSGTKFETAFGKYNKDYNADYISIIKKVNDYISADVKDVPDCLKNDKSLLIIKQTKPIIIPKEGMSLEQYCNLVEIINEWCYCDWRISRPVLDDIVSGYENSAVVSHLPRYTFFCKHYSVADTLFEIDRECAEYDKLLNSMDRSTQLFYLLSRKKFEKIGYKICTYYLKTAVWKRDKSLAQKLQKQLEKTEEKSNVL